MLNDTTQINSVSATPGPSASPAAPAPEPVTCWVGLDWADKKHCLVVRTSPTGKAQKHLVEHQPEALDAWFLQLRQDHPQGRIAVALERAAVRSSMAS